MKLAIKERVERYNDLWGGKYPASRLLYSKHGDREWITGVWMIGNDFSNTSRYYGAYPRSYLQRVMTLFPDCERLLHLFAGSVKPRCDAGREEITFDINPDLNPDVVGDAHHLSEYFSEKFDLVLADPPYSKEAAEKYGYRMINRRTVMEQCAYVTTDGGFLVWLDSVYPMHSKSLWQIIGTIAVVRSTNHVVRMAFIFQRCPSSTSNSKESEL